MEWPVPRQVLAHHRKQAVCPLHISVLSMTGKEFLALNPSGTRVDQCFPPPTGSTESCGPSQGMLGQANSLHVPCPGHRLRWLERSVDSSLGNLQYQGTPSNTPYETAGKSLSWKSNW
jgi:hypothetical protein